MNYNLFKEFGDQHWLKVAYINQQDNALAFLVLHTPEKRIFFDSRPFNKIKNRLQPFLERRVGKKMEGSVKRVTHINGLSGKEKNNFQFKKTVCLHWKDNGDIRLYNLSHFEERYFFYNVIVNNSSPSVFPLDLNRKSNRKFARVAPQRGKDSRRRNSLVGAKDRSLKGSNKGLKDLLTLQDRLKEKTLRKVDGLSSRRTQKIKTGDVEKFPLLRKGRKWPFFKGKNG